MKIYIAYKFTGQSIDELRRLLEPVSQALTNAGHETFIFLRDVEEWKIRSNRAPGIMMRALQALDQCDAILALKTSQEKSEGMLLELGYAKGRQKKVIIAVKEGIQLRFLPDIADHIIYFDSEVSLTQKLIHTFSNEPTS